MFRVITKTSRITFTENYKCSSRLYKTIRHYSKKEKDFCPPTKPQKGRSPLLYALGAVTLVGGATVAYAGYDPDFRKWLGENVPYADDVLKVLLQEETSYLEWLTSLFQDMFTKEGSKKMVKPENLEEVPIEYKPPPNVLGTLEKETPEEVYTEIRIESNRGGTAEPVYEIGGDVKPTDADLPDTHPRNMADLERKLVESAKVAVQAYNSALYALKNYNLDVQKVVESSIDSLDPQIWTSLRTKRDAKDKTLKEAEEAAAEAVQYVNKMKNVVAKKQFESSDTTKEQVKYNIQKVQGDIDIARKEYEHERQMSDVSEKYWDKVRSARTHFADELETLFPTINFEEKKMHVDPSDFDLFVLHAYSNVLFYQKELAKLETVEHEKLQYALAQAKRGDTELLTKAQVECEVEKERRKLQECYQMQCLALKCETEKELRRQLKLQSEAFADHLGDALKVREQELEREFTRKLDEQLEAEKCKFKMQMAAIMGRLQGLDKALKVRARTDKEARRAQVLWNACQQLFRSIKAGCPGVPWPQQLRPLTPEIEAIQKAAAEGDELVKAVLEGIPKEAKERGVFPEDALRERFIKVEQVARKLALVPEGGSKLPLHILSYLQSLLLVKAASPIPQAELNDEEVDFSKLTTNDILQRARYWLDRGDFTQTLRYMNLLQGAPRCVARQWMYETRIMLETQQAADTLMAHAAAIGLAYVN